MLDILNSPLFRQQAYINGCWCDADDQQVFEIYNPADGSVIGTVPKLNAAMIEATVDAAADAFESWKKTTAKQRAQILKNWYQRVIDNASTLAAILSLEQGKPLAEAKGEILYGASFIEWFAEEARRAYGEMIPSHKPDARILVNKKPVGVVAAITPWNFPMAMITRKAAPALAAGCSFIVKPAEDTPFSALALAALAEEAGVPAGVFNVVTGDPVEIGQTLTSSSVVKKLSFTGSTAVGKLLMRQCADTVKRVSLELGGNAPFIVFEDADLDLALQGAMASKYRNAGQTCISVNRFLVQRGVYDQFVDRLSKAVSALSVGRGDVSGVQVGPLINAAAVEKVKTHIDDAIDQGAQVVCGGSQHALGGCFFQPTVVSGVKRGMRVLREETFGPLSAVVCFDTEAEAVAMANDTEYGLAAYFYTQDLARAWRVSEQLEYGMVGINEAMISTEVAPFGGVKESGIGREGARQGIDEYLDLQYTLMGGLAP
ncbi:NAD-dependent succinate-semialdehyde dehydrogenase [Neptuniibacter sp. CAU 1671]|uniref:NAD-dependent succinate-semialdehyde dehydrogenase n=1 Tax=Neptuniibacter sp. CAU 1671 TaxID=3032593 RepID=UPI0023D9D31A|nr:NAD-dependent succinate-semialdehyde dehydrogenase [Neptuniibacter sp. CAU 1671]MDF2182905.1 NAD-dependent succinate-semialdehyde dehydrogenase [Neptuniibacter sp. CAU 1671]